MTSAARPGFSVLENIFVRNPPRACGFVGSGPCGEPEREQGKMPEFIWPHILRNGHRTFPFQLSLVWPCQIVVQTPESRADEPDLPFLVDSVSVAQGMNRHANSPRAGPDAPVVDETVLVVLG
ncbi:unnamed protein product [Sphagnum jensenii]|uniref:Uncharacterized protein n=1 Tax=Sphagnum jensenii TaxID=128206 RepID=A0ABP0WY41_9BRYO